MLRDSLQEMGHQIDGGGVPDHRGNAQSPVHVVDVVYGFKLFYGGVEGDSGGYDARPAPSTIMPSTVLDAPPLGRGSLGGSTATRWIQFVPSVLSSC